MTRRTGELPATMAWLVSSSRPTAAGWSSTSGMVFSSAVDATVAASAIQSRLAYLGPVIRIGIHAGDVEASDGDIAGLPVAVASRLCGVAPPGTVVVSGLVRSLVGVRRQLPVRVAGLAPSERRGRPGGGMAG